jgi:hypothetical protein
MVDSLELKWFNRSTGMLGTLCEEAFFGANGLGLAHNIWAEHNGKFFYGMEIADGHHTGQIVTAKKLCGDLDPRSNMWRARDGPTVPVGFKGQLPEQFGWYLDQFLLIAGIGMSLHGSSSGVLYPLYMHLSGPGRWQFVNLMLFFSEVQRTRLDRTRHDASNCHN